MDDMSVMGFSDSKKKLEIRERCDRFGRPRLSVAAIPSVMGSKFASGCGVGSWLMLAPRLHCFQGRMVNQQREYFS